MGYHFKSIDKMIEDVNSQTDKDTNVSSGTAKLYGYSYEPKRTDDGGTDDLKSKVLYSQMKEII